MRRRNCLCLHSPGRCNRSARHGNDISHKCLQAAPAGHPSQLPVLSLLTIHRHCTSRGHRMKFLGASRASNSSSSMSFYLSLAVVPEPTHHHVMHEMAGKKNLLAQNTFNLKSVPFEGPVHTCVCR